MQGQGMLGYPQDMSFMAQSSQESWQGAGTNGAQYAGTMQQPGLQYPQQYGSTQAAPASLQPVAPKQEQALPYAVLREAMAVNQAADHAADDAMRAIAAAQQTMHSILNPDPSGLGLDGHYGSAGGDDPTGSRRRGGAGSLVAGSSSASARPNKGLRHFSMKVCEKVESKGTTSYNEVADELVAELKDGTMDDGICYDEKNIRRRVYDAINVLMALDIIAKEKKAIIWKGFPTNRTAAQQAQRLQTEQFAMLSEVSRKAEYLQQLVEQQRALKHLLERNSQNPEGASNGTALHLPFILVQSRPDATVEVQISKDMQDVQFNFFNYPFEIHDDALVVKKMLEHESMQKLAAAAAAAAAAVDPMAAATALMEAAAAAQALHQQQQQEQEQQQQQHAGQDAQTQQNQEQQGQKEQVPGIAAEQLQEQREQEPQAAAADADDQQTEQQQEPLAGENGVEPMQ